VKVRQILIPLTLGLGLFLGLAWVLGGASSRVRADPGDVYCVTPGGGSYPAACDQVFTTVQAAVDAAGGGEEIRVAAGVYTGVQARAGITQVVYISETVTVRGGYTTTNGFAGPPDPTANPTTLDAGGLGRVLVISGDISPTVEGLRITGGEATGLGGGSWGSFDAGGGVYVYTATATISDCVVTNNTASRADRGYGGGLYLSWSDATLSGNTVVSNTASTAWYGCGGGLCLEYSDATLSGNTVVSNTASTAWYGCGGGLCLEYSAATLSGNTVQSNTASTADDGDGGGLYLSWSDATLSGNTVVSNTASTAGVGEGGGLCLELSAATLSGNTVQGNTASTASSGFGGGLLLDISDATLSGNTVQGNTASTAWYGYGGGLALDWSDATLSGNTVVSNTASTAGVGLGGGLHLVVSAATLSGNTVVSNTATLSPTATGQGGGLWVWGSSPFTLTNNLVADNQANTQGSGLWFEGDSSYPTSGRLLHTTIADNGSAGLTAGSGSGQGVYVGDHTTLAFTNTILAGHPSVGITVTTGSTATLEGTLWHDNGVDTGGGGVVISSTNVTGDPAFVNPSVWDYHLTIGSAAIDKGVNAGVDEDIDGDSRPQGAGYDLGADEVVRYVYLPLVVRSFP
jgi:hypothetical protein